MPLINCAKPSNKISLMNATARHTRTQTELIASPSVAMIFIVIFWPLSAGPEWLINAFVTFVAFTSIIVGVSLKITVRLFEQVVIPSSDPSFGVMQACQTSLTFVSCCTILFVWFLYNACTCCADNVMLYSLMCMNLLFHYILG